MERALAGAGVQVTVATTDDNGPGAHLPVRLGQPVNESGMTRFYFRKQTEFYKCSFPLQRWLRIHSREFDVVHVHALFSFASVAAARCARQRDIPYVIRPLGVLNAYGMQKRRPLLKRLSFRCIEQPLLRHAAAMHYTSEQERIEARAAGATARPFVIPLGLDLEPLKSLPGPGLFLKRWPEAKGREIILFLSRIDPKKGLDLLIDAFAEAIRKLPGALLVIAGDGEQSFIQQLKARAQQLKISDAILWTGFLEGAEKLSALSAARVFVLPSYSENFGIAAVEALAAGVPTVLTRSVGIADQVQQSDAGIVVGENPREIAAAIERVLRESALSKSLSANARILAQNRYSLEAMGVGLKVMYENVSEPLKRA
jgi:glycosyltransferase involved in cell wall biosynthesis